MAGSTKSGAAARLDDPAAASSGSRTLSQLDVLAGAPCRCLPDPQGDWLPCAYCGLKQAPGKDFCGFCGHRWATAPDA